MKLNWIVLQKHMKSVRTYVCTSVFVCVIKLKVIHKYSRKITYTLKKLLKITKPTQFT